MPHIRNSLIEIIQSSVDEEKFSKNGAGVVSSLGCVLVGTAKS